MDRHGKDVGRIRSIMRVARLLFFVMGIPWGAKPRSSISHAYVPFPYRRRRNNSHPEKCAAPSPTQNATELCPCEECDETVLNTIADGFSCGERIRFLQTQAGGWFSATESCNFVASEFSACRACGPKFGDATSGTPRRFSEIRWSALLWVAVCVPTLSFWAM